MLVINYFGLRAATDVLIPEGFSAEIIEDHTHAPTSSWALMSNADFCFASLRKLYPLADGGAVWSPRGHELPDAPRTTSALQRGAFEKLTGMLLKRLYLQGHVVTKPDFRSRLEAGEDSLMARELSSITPLSRLTLATFPLAEWDRVQERNFRALLEQVPSGGAFRILEPSPDAKRTLLCVLRFRQSRRVRTGSCGPHRRSSLSVPPVASRQSLARWGAGRTLAALAAVVLASR